MDFLQRTIFKLGGYDRFTVRFAMLEMQLYYFSRGRALINSQAEDARLFRHSDIGHDTQGKSFFNKLTNAVVGVGKSENPFLPSKKNTQLFEHWRRYSGSNINRHLFHPVVIPGIENDLFADGQKSFDEVIGPYIKILRNKFPQLDDERSNTDSYRNIDRIVDLIDNGYLFAPDAIKQKIKEFAEFDTRSTEYDKKEIADAKADVIKSIEDIINPPLGRAIKESLSISGERKYSAEDVINRLNEYIQVYNALNFAELLSTGQYDPFQMDYIQSVFQLESTKAEFEQKREAIDERILAARQAAEVDDEDEGGMPKGKKRTSLWEDSRARHRAGGGSYGNGDGIYGQDLDGDGKDDLSGMQLSHGANQIGSQTDAAGTSQTTNTKLKGKRVQYYGEWFDENGAPLKPDLLAENKYLSTMHVSHRRTHDENQADAKHSVQQRSNRLKINR